MRFVCIILFLFLSIYGYSQQYFPVYSQYMMNGLAINPAYAGSRDVLSSSFMFRKQWMGFEGTPLTATLSAHTPLKNRKIGVGLHLIKEEIGITSNLSLFGNYAYRVRLGEGHLSLGLKFGAELFNDDFTKVSTRVDNDDSFSNKESSIRPNLGFGVYYFSNHYFIGASVPLILSYKRSTTSDKYEPYNEIRNYNYLITGGYLFWITNTFKLKPSTLIKYNANSPVQYDLNLNAILLKDGILWLGASYRNKDALVALAEIQMGTKWRMGISYDYSLGKFSNYTSGSIEVMLRMELITVVKTINPRFF